MQLLSKEVQWLWCDAIFSFRTFEFRKFLHHSFQCSNWLCSCKTDKLYRYTHKAKLIKILLHVHSVKDTDGHHVH